MDHKRSLDAAVCWAESNGYSVIIDKDSDDSIDTESKFIFIKSTNRIETQLYVMLHECGHYLVRKNGSVFQYNHVSDSYGEKSKIYKTFVLIEEVEAWRRGYLLAIRLGIPINDERWNRMVGSAINKYADWASA
jgi:hypothetical protein